MGPAVLTTMQTTGQTDVLSTLRIGRYDDEDCFIKSAVRARSFSEGF